MQEDALKKIGCQKIFTDHASGAKTDRPGLKQALSYVREGDVLVVWKVSIRNEPFRCRKAPFLLVRLPDLLCFQPVARPSSSMAAGR